MTAILQKVNFLRGESTLTTIELCIPYVTKLIFQLPDPIERVQSPDWPLIRKKIPRGHPETNFETRSSYVLLKNRIHNVPSNAF